jgi:hypothetical protein
MRSMAWFLLSAESAKNSLVGYVSRLRFLEKSKPVERLGRRATGLWRGAVDAPSVRRAAKGT